MFCLRPNSQSEQEKPGRTKASRKPKVSKDSGSLDMLAPRLKSTATKAPAWKFTSNLRARAFGWRSSALAAKRLKEAVAEIKQAAKTDPQRAADGAVLLLGKIEPAFEQIDSSSGALGTAVNNAIGDLAPVIAAGSSDRGAHRLRLEKLFQALQDDGMGYLDSLGDHWGDMCGADLALEWADNLAETLTHVWSEPSMGWFPGTSACLSALMAAGQYEHILELLSLPGCVGLWHYRRYGFEALKRLGRFDEALAMARQRGLNDPHGQMDVACEEMLIEMGREDEAYQEFGLHLRRASTYKATFSAVCKRYPKKVPKQILRDLVEAAPDPGVWFTAAMGLGELDIGLNVACFARDPKTLTRAAKSNLEKNPSFALQVALIALDNIDEGAGYEITGGDVLAAFDVAKKAAVVTGKQQALETWLAAVRKRSEVSLVKRVLRHWLQ